MFQRNHHVDGSGIQNAETETSWYGNQPKNDSNSEYVPWVNCQIQLVEPSINVYAKFLSPHTFI